LLFERYETHFAFTGLAPRYFYCARNPFDCWRSYGTTEWNGYKTVQEFLAHYMESFGHWQNMQRRAEGRVHLLKLDDLIAATEPLAWYRRNIFDPLELEIPEPAARRITKLADDIGPKVPSKALDPADRRAIADHPGVAALVEELFPNSVAARVP
jgi:hypothetical protein